MMNQRSSIATGRPCRASGWTLIELIAALTVAAIAAGIGTNAYRSALEDARTAEAISDLGILMIEIQKYRVRERGELPESLGSLGRDGDDLIDPWGHSYRYAVSYTDQARSPSGDDIRLDGYQGYDLYSTGPDGAADVPAAAGLYVGDEADLTLENL
jgi:prepilin-type N-terminal cleavage/methylation domain-containing protein